MKYLLLFLLFLALGWHWRNGRSRQLRQRAGRSRGTAPAPVAMVPCAHCGTHLPQHEAVAGVQDVYCSAAHRAAREP